MSSGTHMEMSLEPGQRQSLAKLDPVDLAGSPAVFTQNTAGGFEPQYRGSVSSSNSSGKRKSSKAKLSVGDDPWAIQDMVSTTVPWGALDTKGKFKRVGSGIFKALALLTLLYFFVCSLDCLSSGFQLVSGEGASSIFQESEFISNPVVGVMIGILTTVMVQSSSTSTSIIVTMVASDLLSVEQAIPIIMGANIGTSITNTIVSLTQSGDRNQFRRAFAGATVHDMFNWLTVIVLLIVEVTTHYLLHASTWLTDVLLPEGEAGSEIETLSVITDPFVELIVKLNSLTLDCWASNGTMHEECTSGMTLLLQCPPAPESECNYLFALLGWSDVVSGAVLLVCSLIVLCGCLILIVKVLQSVMQGQISNVIRKTLNAKIPYVPWVTGYIAILIGALMTFLVQSSSVFTSALTPLVGLGVISVQRVYPLTLGSNIGTTTTSLLAAMAQSGAGLRESLQVALCHLLFNVTGILIFYPIPFMRFPIGMAKFLGDTTAKYRWFAIAYMLVMFVLLPVVVMGLSFIHTIAVIVFAVLVFLIFAFVLIVSAIQKRRPGWLPKWLQNWKFLPLPLRSLEPYDRIFSSWACCRKLKQKTEESKDYENEAFEHESGPRNNLSSVQVHDLRPTKNGHSNPAFNE